MDDKDILLLRVGLGFVTMHVLG